MLILIVVKTLPIKIIINKSIYNMIKEYILLTKRVEDLNDKPKNANGESKKS